VQPRDGDSPEPLVIGDRVVLYITIATPEVTFRSGVMMPDLCGKLGAFSYKTPWADQRQGVARNVRTTPTGWAT
jgi:hypothetical protein